MNLQILSPTLPGIYLGAASLICLISYFGARSHRLGFQRTAREGDVTRLWLQWLTWNRSLAPEGAVHAMEVPKQETVREATLAPRPLAASARSGG